jgi:signal transduction histidine kinase
MHDRDGRSSGAGPGSEAWPAPPDDGTAWARWKVIAASASAVLVLLVGAVAFITNRLLDDAGGRATASRQTLAGVRLIDATIRDAESGVRGYLLTGDTAQLPAFSRNADSIEAAGTRLRSLVAANPHQRARLDSLAALSHRKLTELRAIVEARRSGDVATASRIAQAEESRRLTTTVRDLAARMSGEETSMLLARQSVQRGRARTAAVLIIVATLFAFVLAATANLALYRAVRGLARAADTERRLGEQHLAVATENARLYEEARTARGIAEEAHAEAESARRVAERANAAKSDFLSTMSHEIRTPLNAIIGYAELLSLEIAGTTTPEQQSQIGRIRASGQHLLGLLNEVLDLAKVESGSIRVTREEGCTTDVADTALALVRPQAAAKRVSISETCDGATDVTYAGDPQRVRQILVNVLSNAIKFTAPGGRVALRCSARSDAPDSMPGRGPWTTFVVEDTGVGIAPDQQAAIFEPFVQVETGLTRTKGGTGLGLTISRQLARLMDGDLTVESTPDKGSAFTLWLPASAARLHFHSTSSPTGNRTSAEPRSDEALAVVGQTLLDAVDDVVRRHVEALRADPTLSRIPLMTDVQIADHGATFLADIAQSLLILQGAADPAELMRDGSEIQRVISERHGAQRYRLGWEAEELEREFAVLRDVVTDVLRARVALAPSEQERTLTVVMRFLTQAERVSMQTFRHAATVAA